MPPRILFVSRYPPVHCGIAEYTRMLIAALLRVKPRLEIHIAATREALRRDYVDNELLIEIHPVLDKCRGDGSCRKRLSGLLEELGGVDIVHLEHEYGIFGCNPEIFEAIVEAKANGLAERAIVTLHTVYHHAHRECAVHAQRRLAELDVDGVIVHNVLQEFELVNQGLDPTRIHLVPHGTELNPFSSTPRRETLYEAIGVEPPGGGVTVLLPGFIRRDKGVDVLVEAVRRVEGVHAIVAGEPRDPELVWKLRGCKRVTLIPRYLPSRSLQMLMAAVDAVVLPYRDVPGSYSTSGVLHLAMGSFRPILGSRTPRLLELYIHAPRATFHQGSVDETARLLETLVRDPDRVEREMSQLYSYAAETRWDNIARRHLDIYLA